MESIEILKEVSIEPVCSNRYSKNNTSTVTPATTDEERMEQVACGPCACQWYQTQGQIPCAKLENDARNIDNFNNNQSNTHYCNHCDNESSRSEDEFYFFGLNVAAQMRNLPLDVALKIQADIQNILYLARIKTQTGNTTTKANTSSLEPQATEKINGKYTIELQDDDKDPDDDFDLLKENGHSPDRNK